VGVLGGPLEHSAGPDALQKQFLASTYLRIIFDGYTPVPAVMMSVSSSTELAKVHSARVNRLVDHADAPNVPGYSYCWERQQLEECTGLI